MTRISQYSELTSGNLSDADMVLLTDASDTTASPEGTTKKALLSSLGVYIGAGALTVTTVTATPYSATTSNDIILVDCATPTSNVTVDLYAASGNAGRVLHIKKIDSTAYTVIIDGNASETIDGQATVVIDRQWVSLTLVCDGSGWVII